MRECEEIRKLLHPALDRELDIKESLRVQNHLKDCSDCRERLLDEQDLLNLLPSMLRPGPAPEMLRRAVDDVLWREAQRINQTRRRWRSLLSLKMFTAIALLAGFFAIPHPQIPALLNLALAEHRLFMKDPALLLIKEGNPARLTRVLEQRLPFPIRIPANTSDEVRLVGASVASDPIPSAILAYQVKGSPVSLLVTPLREIPLSSADTRTYKNVLFRTLFLTGLHVLEWSNHRNTYVLVACQDTPVDSLPFAVQAADGT